MDGKQLPEESIVVPGLRRKIWLLCILAWLFGTAERSIAILSRHDLSVADGIQIFIASFFLICWVFLKPSADLRSGEADN